MKHFVIVYVPLEDILTPMKPNLSLMFSAALLAATLGYAADAPSENAQRVQVQFDHPENFTDLKDSYMATDKGRESYMEMFKDYLQQNASKRLPEGQKLSITFTDIDMAGDFEPWRGASASDVRIVKAIYIPRLKFTYRITDAAGAVVKEGKAELSDMNFQNNLVGTFNSSDPLRYEKHMLDDWMRDELGARTKKK